MQQLNSRVIWWIDWTSEYSIKFPQRSNNYNLSPKSSHRVHLGCILSLDPCPIYHWTVNGQFQMLVARIRFDNRINGTIFFFSRLKFSEVWIANKVSYQACWFYVTPVLFQDIWIFCWLIKLIRLLLVSCQQKLKIKGV